METLAVVATLLGALSTAILGVIAFRVSRLAQRYSVQRTIGDLQTAVASVRAEYPEIMRVAPSWTQAHSAVLFGRADSPDAAAIVRYYSYVDVGLEFCNTALGAAQAGLVSESVFQRHYRPLIRLFLAENYPFVVASLDGPYLSWFIREELLVAARDGWDWDARHRLLGQDAPPTVSEESA